jgi:hypothetical protein
LHQEVQMMERTEAEAQGKPGFTQHGERTRKCLHQEVLHNNT